MAIKETTSNLRKLISQIGQDLEKADGGNKAASQRVRTGTVKLEKTAKLYRKESISTEKKNKGTKKPAKKAAKPAAKKAAPAKASASASKKPAAKAKSAAKPAAKPAAKAKTQKATARPRALAIKKRPTAKIPQKKNKSWLNKIF